LDDWRQSAPFWAKHAGAISTLFASVTTELISDAGVVEGDRVIDVAGGVGEPSLRIAEIVAPSGTVIATDAIAEMVGGARAFAIERGLANIDFQVCAADSLPFESNLFDVAVCRFGVMLLGDPAAAVSEMIRVVSPGGRVAFAVWSEPEANPFFYVVTEVLSKYVESTPQDPAAPGAFRFSSKGRLARLVADAGGEQVRERTLRFRAEAPLTPEQYWRLRVEMSDTLRNKIATVTEETLDSIRSAVVERAHDFYSDGVLSFPAEVLLVTAVKPRV
jgi:ubiquinone/menaquinone biosynthesis C-methylase UbiE